MFTYGRNQQNLVKQLSSIKNKLFKKVLKMVHIKKKKILKKNKLFLEARSVLFYSYILWGRGGGEAVEWCYA